MPPSPFGLPFVGHTFWFARDPLGFATRCAREHGDVVSYQYAGQSAIQLNHPDYVRHVLVEHNDNYRKGDFMRQELEVIGDGLLTSEGELWRKQRGAIQPIFHPDRIATYGQTMVEFSEDLVDNWKPGVPMALEEELMKLTFSIATDVLFNVDIRNDAGRIREAMATIMDNHRRSRRLPVSLPDWVPTPHHNRYQEAVSTFDNIVADIIDDHREAADSSDDVVSKLLAAEEGMSDRQIRDEVLTLMLAGHETTSLALTYTSHLMATHPRVENRLVDELDSVLGGDAPTVEDLPDLEYTEQVITEALRLYPPVYMLVREPIEDDEIDGYDIPSGSLISMFQWVIHRDPRFYDDPESFRPERWADVDKTDRHPFAYFPFGGGPRRCLGDRFGMMEAQLLLATIAQQYRLEPVSETLSVSPDISLRPDGSVEMIPRPRDA